MLDMNSNQDTLLDDIEAFLRDTGMGASYFGKSATGNSEIVKRLRNGKTKKGRPVRIWPDTEAAIRAFMLAERQKRVAA